MPGRQKYTFSFQRVKPILLFTFVIFSFCGISQNSISQSTTLTQAIEVAKKGTYQIVLKPGTDKTDLPSNIILMIEPARDQNLITYLEVNANTKVRIFPYSTINNINFIAPEEYVYEP